MNEITNNLIIQNPEPGSWQNLQKWVYQVFKELRYNVEIEKKTQGVRGEVEIDVFVENTFGETPITYVIECKYWDSKIPQTIVHALYSVVQDLGANIGYIISTKGLQPGALKYIETTNIKALTYVEFQELYALRWYREIFVSILLQESKVLSFYLHVGFWEIIEKNLSLLNEDKYAEYYDLLKKYIDFFSCGILPLGIGKSSKNEKIWSPENTQFVIDHFNEHLPIEDRVKSFTLRDIMMDLLKVIHSIIEKFDKIMGQENYGKKHVRNSNLLHPMDKSEWQGF